MVQLSAQRSLSRSRHPCDLFVLVPFHIVQHKHAAERRRELGHRSVQVDASIQAVARTSNVRSLIVRHSCLPARILSFRFQHCVDCQPVRPARKRGVSTISAESFPYSHENILQQFSGARAIASHAHAQREEAAGV